VPTLSVLDASDGASRQGLIRDSPHARADVRDKFARPGPFPIAALDWCGDGPSGGSLAFSLREHVGWLAPDGDLADPTDVVKQVSFLQASATETTESFRTHYRDHVDVARRHMPSLWQYVQYDVTGMSSSDPQRQQAAAGFVAVSVLWFRTSDDFLHRYFASPEDEAEFRSHEGFLDLSKAFTFVAGVDPSAAPNARP
jgi:hypothetical protein